MVEAVWCDAGAHTRGRLLLVVHHLAVDAVSWRIIAADLATAWQQTVTTGTAAAERPTAAAALSAVTTSYRRWALLLASQARGAAREAELPLWEAALNTPIRSWDTGRSIPTWTPPTGRGPWSPAFPPPGPNPCSPPSPPSSTPGWRTSCSRVSPSPSVHGARSGRPPRRAPAGRHRRTPRPGGPRPRADRRGRRPVPYGRLVHQPLPGQARPRTRRCPRPGNFDAPLVERALKRVKEQLRTILDHGVGYGMLRHLNPDTRPRLATAPEPQIGFNYLGRYAASPVGGVRTPTGTWCSTAAGRAARTRTCLSITSSTSTHTPKTCPTALAW
ncbi:hypothetical protein NKH18_05390 [Streptomyces sp. M10(2022)]